MEHPTAAGPDDDRASRITARAVIIGLLLIILNSLWLVDLELIEARSYPSDLALFLNVIAFMLVLLAINRLLRAVAPRHTFTQTELLVIYIMLAMGTAVSGQNTIQAMIANIGHVTWFASPENRWATLISPHLPDWLVVKDKGALSGFYLGRSSLHEAGHWRAWALPVAAWLGLWASLLWTGWCVAVLLSRRWVRSERLSFPIAQLVLEMTRPDGSLFRRPLLWLGFGLACLLGFFGTLHALVPAMPNVSLSGPELSTLAPPGSVWRAIYPTYSGLYPWVLGLSFLAPLDLLFSTWFFFALRKFEMVGVVAAGWGQDAAWPLVQRQCAGAFLGIGLAALWGGRRDLAQAFRGVFTRDQSSDRTAPSGHRIAAPGAVAGLLASIIFGWASGMPVWVSACFFGYFLMVGVASARIRAELGPPSNDLVWVGPDNLIPELAGTRLLSPQALTSLSLHHWYNRYYSWIAMAHQADALKLFSTVDARPRRAWGPVVMGALMLGSVATAWIVLHWLYRRGGLMVPDGIAWQGNESFGPLAARLEAPQPPNLRMIVAVTGGMVLTFGLLAARARFLGNPFHPVGLALGGVYLSDMFWISVFLAWVAKAFILRYGGRRGFERALPFFLGLVFGQTAVGAIWILLGTIFGLPVGRIWR